MNDRTEDDAERERHRHDLRGECSEVCFGGHEECEGRTCGEGREFTLLRAVLARLLQTLAPAARAELSRVAVSDACPAGAYFLCLAKESRQRKSRLRRRPCGVPCAARLAVAPRNSLRSLRDLRSDSRGELEDEAR